jgi:hypothetical protein
LTFHFSGSVSPLRLAGSGVLFVVTAGECLEPSRKSLPLSLIAKVDGGRVPGAVRCVTSVCESALQ